MQRRIYHFLLILSFLLPLGALSHPAAHAQDSETLKTYHNEALGVRFHMPEDWTVTQDAATLIAGTPADVEAFRTYQPPAGLVITINLGTYASMNVRNAGDIQAQMPRFVPSGVTPPEPQTVTFGDASGYSLDFPVPDSDLYTRVVLLTVPNARLAVVRAYAPRAAWIDWGSDLFIQIMQSMTFSLPADMADPLADLPDQDGGVLWHYQAALDPDQPTLDLGGIAYDDFGVMYVAAGPRGILALNKSDGTFVNFLGPIADDDNLRDVALGPQDALLYFANASPGDNNRIMVTDRLGNYVRGWGTAGEDPGQFAPGMPRTLAVTRQNEIWTISEGHTVEPRDRLYRFDRFGNMLAMINLVDVNPLLRGIHLDNNIQTGGLFLVGERGGLNILDSDGSILVPNIARELIEEAVPLDIAIGPEGLIVIATQEHGFMQFTNLGELVDRFGFPYDAGADERFAPGQFHRPAGMVIDTSNTVYVAETNLDSGFAQVQAFSFTGSGNLPLPGRTAPDDGNGDIITADGGAIAYGTTVQGRIDNRSPQHDYTFEAVAGDTVQITMRAVPGEGNLDPLLVLLDGANNEIGRNDDASNPPAELGPRDAMIRFAVGRDGTYTIQATRFGGSGLYELTVIRTNPASPTATPTP